MSTNLDDSDRHNEWQICTLYEEQLNVSPGSWLISHGYLVRKSLCGVDQRFLFDEKFTRQSG